MTYEAPPRPDPDALLAALKPVGHGRLRVFLGAAPGVGKTYAMLSGARRLRQSGLDVVVGLVETHGRQETQALLDGLETLPRRMAPYRGATLQEFDLDAALARRPALLILDELAHTNAPESRHPKRFQDVAELLQAGIDVWTAINIQHLESLSDVVFRITGVTVRETVPDTVLDGADEVVMVDVTPAELIQRLEEGRIYLPDNAARAADAFFRPGNLTALRELALRRTADRVDDQMVEHLRINAIEGAWPTVDRLLVCVGADAGSEAVVRAASRLASGLNATWVAVTLERASETAAALRRVDETMRLAERLGAETARLAGRDLPEEILRFARRENITQIVIGASGANFWARLRGRSLTSALLQQARDVSIHVVVTKLAPPRRPRFKRTDRRAATLAFSNAFGWVALATAAGEVVSRLLSLSDLSMVFMAAVLGCAVTAGQWPAVTASVLSFLAYNFFFVPPVYTFTIAEPREILALFVFLLVAVFAGGLAGRVRDQAQAAQARATAVQSLYDVSRKLSRIVGLDDVLWIVASQAATAIRGQVLVLLDDGAGELTIRAAFPPEDQLSPGDWGAAHWAFAHNELAGWRTGTLPTSQFQFQPIRASAGVVGVVGYAPGDRREPLSAERQRTLEALIDQGTLAIERAHLTMQARRLEAAAEREKLQTTLLSSISHDLRTPLATILGAVTGLRGYGASMTQADRDDLLAAIEEETRRLARFVSNLLDMTRVEAGALDLKRDWLDVADVVRAAVGRAEKAFPLRRHAVSMTPGLPLLRGDPLLFEQALFNLLENADKYSGPESETKIGARVEDGDVVLFVEDQGPGVPPSDLDRIFEKFARGGEGDGRPPGVGLGLAIARGVVGAMGGAIHGESPTRDGRGARFVIRLPGAAAAKEEAA